MSPDLKASFKNFNEEGLCAYFEKIIDKNKYGDVMLPIKIMSHSLLRKLVWFRSWQMR